MAAEENWQTKLSTIAEKTAFIFNKELLREGGGHLLALFFFSSAGSFLKQVNRSQMRQVLAQKSSNIDNRMSTGVDD